MLCVSKGLKGCVFMTPPTPTLAPQRARRNSLNEQGRNLEVERRVGDPSFRVGGGSLLQSGGGIPPSEWGRDPSFRVGAELWQPLHS